MLDQQRSYLDENKGNVCQKHFKTSSVLEKKAIYLWDIVLHPVILNKKIRIDDFHQKHFDQISILTRVLSDGIILKDRWTATLQFFDLCPLPL